MKFYKLAWDAVGSEFASRHTQYEMFYAGASFVTKAHSFRTFDWDHYTRLVDEMLDTYSLEQEVATPQAARERRRCRRTQGISCGRHGLRGLALAAGVSGGHQT